MFAVSVAIIGFTVAIHCRVLITAVDASDTDLKLVFFNNCLFNEDPKYREGTSHKVGGKYK